MRAHSFVLSEGFETEERPFVLCGVPSVQKAVVVVGRYTPYVTGRMTPEQLEQYDCSPSVRAAWNTPDGNFSGPCCRKKK